MGFIVGSYFAKTALRSPPFDTKYGKIVGKQFCIENGRYVNAFLGIPFAAPPVADLRFKEPQPPKSWDNVRLCISHGPRSPQKGIVFERFGPLVETNEDCLYLNVFAPQWDCLPDQPDGRAVMIFIHGGGFVVHSSANYGDLNICRNLCSKEVVVVTIQYRLGLLGFCATGDENCTSNLGLRDQMMALKWVKENISNFNGDPNNITLFGQSAGAASVDILCLSPYTCELFNKAILLGGSASCEWAIADINDVRQSAIEIARKLGWKPTNTSDTKLMNKSMMDFFKKQSSKRLALSLTGTKRTEKNPYGMYFVPVIDGDFLPAPIDVLRKRVPKKLCITGTTEYEGLLFVALARKFYGLKHLRKIIPNTFTENKFEDYKELQMEAAAMYFKPEQTKKEVDRAYVKLLSDVFINNGVHEFAEHMTLAEHTVYLYSFTYSSAETFGFLSFLFPFIAATHTLELPFLFDKGIISNFKATPEDRKVMNKFTTLMTNFAIKGNPNGPEDAWKPLVPNDTYRYFNINLKCSLNPNYEDRRPEFWHKIKKRRNMSTSIS